MYRLWLDRGVRLMMVCTTCGIVAALTGSGKWVHVAAIPREYEEHDVENVIPHEEWVRLLEERASLKQAVADLVLHHATLHPLDGCEWSRRVNELLRTR